MLSRSRDVLMLSIAIFLLVSASAVGYGSYTIFSRQGEWVGGVVRQVITGKDKQDLAVGAIVDRVADKILARVVAKDEKLQVRPLVEKLLDKVLDKVVQKVFSNEGDVLFKGLIGSREVGQLLKQVTDHVLIHRQDQLVKVVKKVAPIHVPMIARNVVSHVLRRDKKPLIDVASRLVKVVLRHSSHRGGTKAVATAVIDHVFAHHQARLTEIMQKVAPINIKKLSQKLLEQMLRHNRKDIALLAQNIIIGLTQKVHKRDVEAFTRQLLDRILQRHKKDIVDIIRGSANVKLEHLLPRVADRILKANKPQIVYIIREVLKVDFGKMLKEIFSKKKR